MKGHALRVPLFIVNSLLVLPLGCIVALVWANAWPDSYFRVSHALSFWVNDVGIVLFFRLMAKEVREEMLPGGDLHPWRRAALAVAAAIGGALVPVVIYVWFLRQVVSEPMLVSAWVVTCAVDVAACYLIAGFIFGRHPAVPFVLLMAIASNAIGLILIATLHTSSTISLPGRLALVALAIGSGIAMRRSGVAAGLYRVPRVGWRELIVVGSTASIGLTFALFFGTSLFDTGPLQLQTRSAALFTACGAAFAILIAWHLGRRPFRAPSEHRT